MGTTSRSMGRRSGLSLFEAILAVSLFAVFMTAIGVYSRSTTQVMVSETLQTEVDTRMRRTVNKIVRELMASGPSSFAPAPAGTETLSYRKSTGVTNGVRTWSELHRFELVLETGELDDGLDNNGNGLVDEGRVEWTIDAGGPTERMVVLCHGVSELFPGEEPNGIDDNGNGLVDEPGLHFEEVGGQIVVRMALQRLDRRRNVVTRSLTASVRARN